MYRLFYIAKQRIHALFCINLQHLTRPLRSAKVVFQRILFKQTLKAIQFAPRVAIATVGFEHSIL